MLGRLLYVGQNKCQIIEHNVHKIYPKHRTFQTQYIDTVRHSVFKQ